jgi:hypothetical protein
MTLVRDGVRSETTALELANAVNSFVSALSSSSEGEAKSAWLWKTVVGLYSDVLTVPPQPQLQLSDSSTIPAIILLNYSHFLVSQDDLIGASKYLRLCLEKHPSYLAARESLDGVCAMVVDRYQYNTTVHDMHLNTQHSTVVMTTVSRWHFRMLNDVDRNAAFKAAIEVAVRQRPGCVVLDIGAVS